VFDCLSLPPSIEEMDYQWRSCHRREEGTARVEVKTTPDHNEKENKQANDQRALFDLHQHDDPSNAGRDSRLPHPRLPFLT